MFQFCFNDCLPKEGDVYILNSCLSNTLDEYSSLKKVYPDHIEGIFTELNSEAIKLNENGYSLSDCIKSLSHSLKRIAYSSFNKFPIDDLLSVGDLESILYGNYTVAIGDIEHSAITAKIAAENDGVLFTLALHDDLKKNVLNIKTKENPDSEVQNLFGENNNTGHIKSLIYNNIIIGQDNLNKLRSCLRDCTLSGRFTKEFEKASNPVQESVISHFQHAIDRQGPSRFFADRDLIKDVTPQREQTIKVYELRIFSPVAYRIYFYEENSKIFLALMEPKSSPKTQDNDIKNAAAIIHNLLITKIEVQTEAPQEVVY